MKVSVKSHENLGLETGHVNSVQLIHMDDNIILLDIDLRTKHKGVSAYGGATDEDCQSIWIGGDEIQMELPEGLRHNVIFAEVSRYTIHVCIYRYGLLEEMQDADYDKVVLWMRSPE